MIKNEHDKECNGDDDGDGNGNGNGENYDYSSSEMFLIDEYQSKPDSIQLRREWIRRISVAIVNDDVEYLRDCVYAWLLKGDWYDERAEQSRDPTRLKDFYFDTMESMFAYFNITAVQFLQSLTDPFVSDEKFMPPIKRILMTFSDYIIDDLNLPENQEYLCLFNRIAQN